LIPGRGWEFFTPYPDWLWGPSILQWLRGALSLGVKQVGHEVDHSPPSSAEVKECMELYPHSPIRLHSVVLKAQGQLYFTKSV